MATRDPSDIDHTPLTFGQFKGKTPDELSQTERGQNYIVWLYDTVTNKPTCSELLARACGWKPPAGTKQAAIEEAKSTGRAAKLDPDAFKAQGLDDFEDDDIPF